MLRAASSALESMGHCSASADNWTARRHRGTCSLLLVTCRPLLLRIKKAYDIALEDALHMTHDNVHMRAELAAREQVQVGRPLPRLQLYWQGRGRA